MTKLKCPLKFSRVEDLALNAGLLAYLCIEKECAWWDNNLSECAILVLSLKMSWDAGD